MTQLMTYFHRKSSSESMNGSYRTSGWNTVPWTHSEKPSGWWLWQSERHNPWVQRQGSNRWMSHGSLTRSLNYELWNERMIRSGYLPDIIYFALSSRPRASKLSFREQNMASYVSLFLSGRRAKTVGTKVREVTVALMMNVWVQSFGVIRNVVESELLWPVFLGGHQS